MMLIDHLLLPTDGNQRQRPKVLTAPGTTSGRGVLYRPTYHQPLLSEEKLKTNNIDNTAGTGG